MRQVLKLRNYKITKLHNPESGYMLITLMLIIALAAMALLAMLPEIGQQIKRDQEEELRHRGSSYMRAIQRFYKKFGRYPTRIEELENTNKIRFLRKRYTDPMTRDPQTGKEKDFKFLHMQDVHLNNGPLLAGARLPVQNQPTGPNGPSSSFSSGPQGGLQSALGQIQQSGVQTSVSGIAPNNAANDESEPGNPANPQGNSNPSSPFSSSPNTGSNSGGGFNGPTFGGGPILGVASTSKAKSIREFDKKNHYNDWLFIYDPTTDRGGLLVGPWQTMPVATLPGAVPVAQPQGGQLPQYGPGISQPNLGPPQNPPAQPPQSPEQN
jgi:type II secretory pathway pseudopilin PulG